MPCMEEWHLDTVVRLRCVIRRRQLILLRVGTWRAWKGINVALILMSTWLGSGMPRNLPANYFGVCESVSEEINISINGLSKEESPYQGRWMWSYLLKAQTEQKVRKGNSLSCRAETSVFCPLLTLGHLLLNPSTSPIPLDWQLHHELP